MTAPTSWRRAGLLALPVSVWLISSCERAPAPASTPTQQSEESSTPSIGASTQRANPASTNCVKVGGRLVIERRPDGGEFGVCLFEDNHQCEEWALLRGECPEGGRRITGYATQAGRFCAITGGQYTDVAGNGASDERGNCVLPGGKVCEAEAYYLGTCGKG